ncbi:hypothetical protein [Variovorax sp. PAMC26660]|jgi:hypothetical protein|uniref:hypothetical protein n=1 Tax=Variovorax sp. PAMC26660 TaxID=2762322 RepID=UPI00164DFE73|nr:hypothetical protein [Variovorax sp. PAMC26660]QNK69513.1 hypothetical protein H7F35_07400 [Variovorax sp. PAMC26660]
MTSTSNDDLLAQVVFASTQAGEQIMRRDGTLPPLGIAFLGEAANFQVLNPLEEDGAKDLGGERLQERVHERLCAIAQQRDDVLAVSTVLYKRERGRIYVQVELPDEVLRPLAFAVARVNGVWTVSDSWMPLHHFVAAPVFAR